MKVIKTISAILLATLVLISSTSFMIGMHYCGGKVQKVTLFSKAAGCIVEHNLPPCHKPAKSPCCEDKTVVHKGDDFKTSLTNIHIIAPASIDIAPALVILSEVIPTAPDAQISYHHYDPPLRSYDITVTQQVFLI